jgi:protein SCO1/2
MVRALPLWITAAWIGLLAGCSPKTESGSASSTANSSAPAEGSITNYASRGVVQAVHPEKKSVVIKHEEIPGYMPAMTMPFQVRDTNELKGLSVGGRVEFRLRVTEKDGWIDQLKPVTPPAEPAAATVDPTSTGANPNDTAIRILPNVPALKAGDAMVNYGFTNQLGNRFNLESFRGNAYAFTFIFTRCPFPTFCPRITDHFTQVQKLMTDTAGAPTNWRLVSISIDPEYDTEAVLKGYGNRAQADPARWWLARADYDTLDRITGHFGQYYGRGVSVAAQNHNLRTVVIDAGGRVHEIFMGNEWTPAELVKSLTDAAGKR